MRHARSALIFLVLASFPAEPFARPSGSNEPRGAEQTAPDSPGASVEAVQAPTRLRVEYLESPLGLDTLLPRLSWEVVDPRRGALQSAWQVIVSEDLDRISRGLGEMWDSGKVVGRETNQVEYAGKPLTTFKRYMWAVRTFDLAGKPSPWSAPATFGIGPRETTDWTAEWIGEPDASVAAAASGARKGYHSAFAKKPDEFKYVQVDFGAPTVFDEIRIHPARPDGDATKRGVLFPLQYKLYVDDYESFDRHYMKVSDHTWGDVPNAGAEPEVVKLSRYKIRYLRFVPEKMQEVPGKGFAFALGEIEVLDTGNNITKQAKVTASDSLEEDGWTVEALADGELLGRTGTEPAPAPASSTNPAIFLREEFNVSSRIKRATLYASALGLYEMTINGTRVGDERLAPGWTDYRVRVPYQTFDVTALVQNGANAIGATLAPGWFAGRIGLAHVVPNGKQRGIYGAKPRLLAQLLIEREDATRQIVATSASWRVTNSGPIRTADLLDGETYDARNEIRSWDRPGFDESGWLPAATGADVKPKPFAQIQEPVRAVAHVPAKRVVELSPGVFLYDFGENLVGVVRVRATGTFGQEITLRHGEMRDKDGSLYVANLRGAKATDRFVMRGLPEGETFEPRFTSHGFRYVEITGLKSAPPLEAVNATVLSTDARTTGSFECSDPILNELWANAQRSLRGNFVGLPTDCPQRDERLGWMGDIQVFAGTALFQRDVAASFAQWLGEARGAQARDGRFPDFAPHPYDSEVRFSGAPGWADAAISVPFEAYVHYHDARLAEATIAPAMRWLEFVRAKNPELVWKESRGNDYGDWLNGNAFNVEGWTASGHEVPKDVFATAFLARSADLAARLAFAVGNVDAARRANEIADGARAAFQKTFVASDGTIQGDTQAGYALALAFDLLPDGNPRVEAADRLARKIEVTAGSLDTGFMATHRALLALSRYGHHDLAVRLARKTSFPSWGYAIERGATTMWERMDGWIDGRGFQDPGMNSFNHYAFGAVGEWMVREIAGIQPDVDRYVSTGSITLTPVANGKTRSSAQGPLAFEHFTLRPRVEGGLAHAKATYDSIVGRIESGWTLDGAKLEYVCTVPANSSATLELPAKDLEKVREGDALYTQARGVIYAGARDGRAVFELGAGSYRFTSDVR